MRFSRKTPAAVFFGAAVLALLLLLALTLWLALSRPTLWLPLLNRQLPTGLQVTAAKGLRPGLTSIGWHIIELRWDDQTLRLEQGHVHWRIRQLRPLEIQLTHVETQRLTGSLAPPRPDFAPNDEWQPLPHFWEQPWWPIVSAFSGTVGQLDIYNHTGAALLSGALHWQQGAQRGEAAVSGAGIDIWLEWSPHADHPEEPNWSVRWQTHGLVHSDGEVQLEWLGEQLAFRLQGELHDLVPQTLGAGSVPIHAAGQLDLFTATRQLLSSDWAAHGHHVMESGALDWSCYGLLALPTTLDLEPELSHCELTSLPVVASLHGPITFDWQRLALQWEQDLELKLAGSLINGTVYFNSAYPPNPGKQGCAWAEDCELSLRLHFDPGSWNGLTWSNGEAETHLFRSGEDNSLQSGATTLNLSWLRGGGFSLNDVSLSLSEVMLWQPQLTQWHIERLDGRAGLRMYAVDAELTGRGTLTDLEIAAPEQWSSRLELALDPSWQRQLLPTLYLDQQWRQAGDNIDATGTLASGALGTLLDHQLSFTTGQPPHFAARLDSSSWPAAIDITAALLGNQSTLLPIRGLHGMIIADITGTWRENGLHLDVHGQAKRLAGLYEHYAFAGLALAPFHWRWDESGLHTVRPLRWQAEDFNIGMELSNLEGVVTLHNADWRLSDVSGELLDGHFRLDHLSPLESGTLRLEALDLATAVALMNQPDLSASGQLSGRLPVALEDGSPVVREGELRNDAPGVIRYRPAPDSDFLRGNPQTALVGDTLSNFHYQRLEADVSYRANGDLLLFTHLQGRNPDLESAPAIHLNLNVEQNVPSLLRSLRAGEDIGAWLEQRIQPE